LDIAKQRERARQFLENFNHADPRVFEEAITDDFTFEIVSSMTEFPPLKGRREFVEKEVATLRRLFPQGLNMTIETIICEGPHVAALARCAPLHTTAGAISSATIFTCASTAI
jgi:ketosteroid isomerase-like protein